MITHKGTQTIKTQRLILRRFTVNDASDMFNNWANDERVTRFLTWEPHGNLENTQNLLKLWCCGYDSEENYNWAITYNEKVIGSLSVVRMSNRDEYAEIGYCLGYESWNNGMMTEAVKAVITFLFEAVGFNKVCISHAVKNPASGMVAKKCGLKLDGVKREDFKSRDGEFYDIAIYSILKSEWERNKREL